MSSDPNAAPTETSPTAQADLPYPTYGSGDPGGAPALPYPTSDPVYPVDPAYPPPGQGVPNNGQTAGESAPTIPGTTGQEVDGDKQPDLPPYSAPPPSYMDTFPAPQPQPPAQPQVTVATSGYTAQYVAPLPQEMIRRSGGAPCAIQCPRCSQQITTSVTYTSGMLVYLVSFVVCLFGGIFGCCLIPFCIDGLKDTTHHCPNCKHMIGKYDRLS